MRGDALIQAENLVKARVWINSLKTVVFNQSIAIGSD